MKIPEWINVKPYDKKSYLKIKNLLEKYKINTVCIEANCPNRYECFSKGKATFMILGDVCTRNCLYCNIKKGLPKPVDRSEPKRIANLVKKMKLNYAVITCVTRDDLEDGGANQFIKVVEEIRKLNHNCKIELLISDLNGNWKALEKIVFAKPDVINHNIEVVEELFPKLRPKGSYERSLELLKKIKEIDSNIKTKSGFMVGLGESKKQIIKTLKDLKNARCDIVTIGQYLQPSHVHYSVKKYYTTKEFQKIKEIAEKIGFEKVFAGPLVRSSYRAEEIFG